LAGGVELGGRLPAGRHASPPEWPGGITVTDTGSSQTVRWERDGAVATITLNRPQARNALTVEMKNSLLAALGRAAADPAVRAVIITGAGDAFCAGQDLREHGELLAAGRTLDTVRLHYNPIITAVMTMPKPVI